MKKLPFLHYIDEIKTKLGFGRTLTAPGQDVVDATNQLSGQIGDLANLETYDNTDLVSAVNSLVFPEKKTYKFSVLAARTLYTQCRFYIYIANTTNYNLTVNQFGITNYFGKSSNFPGSFTVTKRDDYIEFIYNNNSSGTYFQNDTVLDCQIEFTLS